ncbi:MAG: hypothetical protein JWM11_4927 [Planctomycetaceae bacterium]|nr:hypothetical protein [Planctomycetaceae bacterium]
MSIPALEILQKWMAEIVRGVTRMWYQVLAGTWYLLQRHENGPKNEALSLSIVHMYRALEQAFIRLRTPSITLSKGAHHAPSKILVE